MKDTYMDLFKKRELLCNPMSPIDYFKISKGEIFLEKGEIGFGTYSISLDLEPFLWGDELINTVKPPLCVPILS